GAGRRARAAALRPVRPAPGPAGRGNRRHRAPDARTVSDATPLLQRLLRKGESARLRGEPRPASLPMTSTSNAREYLALATLVARDAFHGQIALAERAGAIDAVRDRHRGDGEQLLRIGVKDLDALAAPPGVALIASRTAVSQHARFGQ